MQNNKPKLKLFDRLTKGLYNLKDKEGNYYATSPLQDRQYANFLDEDASWKDYQAMDNTAKAEFLKSKEFADEDAFVSSILNEDKMSELNTAAEAERTAMAGGVGSWEPDNRDVSKQIMKDWIGEHKLKTLGYGLGSAVNLAGLTDNDKFGGQIGGAALGAGIGSFYAPMGLGAVPMAMAGGAIGSLFDKLRAKREQQAQYPQYYGR